MAENAHDLGSARRTALQAIFSVFQKRGEWPTFQHVDRQLDRAGLVAADVLASLPLNIAQYDRYHPATSSVALTVAGVRVCEDADAELALFLCAVRWCTRKEQEFEPPSPTKTEQLMVSSTQFAAESGEHSVGRVGLVQVLALLHVEWLTIGSTGPAETEPIWQVTLDHRIRPYRDVASIDEYLAIKARILDEAAREVSTRPFEFPAPDRLGGVPAIDHPEAPPDPHKVFVAMAATTRPRLRSSSCCGRSGFIHWSSASCEQRPESLPRTSGRFWRPDLPFHKPASCL